LLPSYFDYPFGPCRDGDAKFHLCRGIFITHDSGVSKKKVQTIRKRLDRLDIGLSEEEKILFARSLAATPDERWRMHENFLRSLNLSTHSARKAYGFK
jgi:hypothetical protein